MSAHLRIVRGDPTAEEVAAVTAVVTAMSSTVDSEPEKPQRGRWNDPARSLRQPWLVGPGGWRAGATR